MTEKEFISGWITKLKQDSLKKFPDDFISFECGKKVPLPGKTLIMGEEFFGAYEILSVNGTPVFQASSHDEAKFVIYAGRENKVCINIPANPEDLKNANRRYEAYLDSIIKDIETGYRKIFPELKNSSGAVNDIFRAVNLTRY